jgi:hypothetical protein
MSHAESNDDLPLVAAEGIASSSPPDPIPAFLEIARKEAAHIKDVADAIAADPALQAALALRLSRLLPPGTITPVPILLAKLTVETLKKTCDDLFRPVDLDPDPEARWLYRPFYNEHRMPQVELWVAARLCWFAGHSQEAVAKHIGRSKAKVQRCLPEAAEAIDALWMALFPPDAAPPVPSGEPS